MARNKAKQAGFVSLGDFFKIWIPACQKPAEPLLLSDLQALITGNDCVNKKENNAL